MNIQLLPPFPKIARQVTLFLIVAWVISACQPAAASTPAPSTALPSVAPVLLPSATLITSPTVQPTTTPSPLPTAAPTATADASPSPAFDEPAISVLSHPTLGDILVGDNGMTLYIFTQDEPGESSCAGACLDFWTPLRTQGSPQIGLGIDPALVGSTALADGSRVLTYNQMPLYYFYLDSQPGDAAGAGVDGAWFALSPSGAVVQLPPAGQPTSAPSQDKEKEDKGNDYGSDY